MRGVVTAVAPSATTVSPEYLRIDRSEGRSMVMSSRGVVASEHPLASQTGAMILARGGHAVDAAIAANAVMGLVAPMMNGIGGDMFAMVLDAQTDSLFGVNASGRAPAGLTLDFLAARGHVSMPQTGIHSVTVPGAVAGWTLLHERFGRRPLSDVLADAIGLADEGVPVTELTAAEWAASEVFLRKEPDAIVTYLPGGRAPRPGQPFRNPDLARSYQQIAEQGRDGFYRGSIAERIVSCSDRRGGTITLEDLDACVAEWVEPICTAYRGWNVYELPPNGQGIAALLMLNILENFPVAELGHNQANTLHALIEAKKLAYADLGHFVADPGFSLVPTAALLSKTYARFRASLIDPARANGDFAPGTMPPRGGDTTYLSVVDRDGNMVSLIQSNFAHFGSGLVPEDSGFVLQNRGGLFSMDPEHPNRVAPAKRPLHTSIPGFMRRDDCRIAFGIMGGWNQAQAHAQFVSNVVDHRMHIQAALDAARFTKLTFGGCGLLMEARVPQAVRSALTAMGHEIRVRGDFASAVGGGQSVMRTAGVNYGASDPRKDGSAIPEPFAHL